ncbi:MAG: recombination regulator RecX [Candidatus Accumulibacter sp.]|jgi:regulatory protein|nr:recombination regulator RecX [Accumulibacter sp.]
MTEPSLRERALRLLARREYARAELARKLASHTESIEEIDTVLDELVSRRLLSDARYAEMRMRARGARFGNARLAQELRAAGVSDELVDRTLAGAKDELARASETWRRKYGGAGVPPDAAGWARQANFLARRGFSGETIRHVLCSGHHEDD